MDYQNKKYLKDVIDEYEKMPDVNMMDKEIYDKMREIFNQSPDITNGQVINTLKLMVIQMCEKLVEIEYPKSFTEEVQEEYK
tara:strand:+ start:445 stop:690 length:246 start_codon:yes stop_codon:yes gene_type:complete